ncbi:hydroxysteroid 11-beta-dehydrogenase 1-like protein isoform X1 [Haliotis rufescens]|uniref:hydroxysteroid 11-beta-dehydrogenase 1-like protein isoform X1 n=1 Tax=Haliotis rufescens TaxID=6454 RepID=UPI00201F883F|nr:hydroxysteroid 11-beta-dehydrogenase 1-like protein isoform X1 [Haliotis rufescens]XP_048251067.1 hydroxysteroid 11-beta-dehydrogenase 1-like protein isoform X1 [Haliotis rufescens]XP_048251068.1 hydroxysteroid 11-beta-dehydrogenase 1-like protein isoform X1 [Haliotis rufescens]XP_048251069.1 hydroxysteroid 11-beta-dehydrogenase 1-like protein isoform X1 [Haliotis rufescens]
MWKKILAVLVGLVIGYWLYDDFDPETLNAKRVVITGASTGIGEQIAYHYARFGAKILITARREEVLKQVVDRCRQVGSTEGQYEYITADMSDMSATQNVIREATRRLGGIDILVLNHITVMPLGEWKGTPQNLSSLQHIFDVNFRAYVHLTSHAFSELEKTSGSVIVVSSFAGKVSIPFVAPYSASKFALDGFFSALRQELRMKNCDISITLCIIGLVGTDNALSKLMEFRQDFLLSVMKPATPTDTALAIVKGGQRRVREIYYPYLDVRIPYLLRDWLPNAIESVTRYISTPSHYKR